MNKEEQKTLLLVEDEALIAMEETVILEKYGYKVVTADTGENAIKAVETFPGIDLILMDINLGSGIEGTEAAEKILEKHDLPLIFLSSHTDREVVEKTEGITSYGYIVKNSGETVLIASIKMAFRLFEARMKELEKEEALRESKDNYASVVELANDGLVVIQDGMHKYFNEAWIKTTGYSRDELLKMSIEDMVVPEQKELVMERYESRMAGKNPPPIYETRIQCKNGTVKDLELSAGVIKYNGQPAGMASIRDITKRKRAQKALIESEEKFRKLSEAAEEGIFIHENGLILDCNEVSARMIRCKISEIIGTQITRYITPDSIEIAMQNIASGYDKPYEVTVVRTDGSTFPCEGTGRTFEFEGKMQRVVTLRDISDRKQAEETLHENERKYRLLADNISDTIWILDFQKGFTYISPSIDKLTGYTVEERMAIEIDGIYTPESKNQISKVLIEELERDGMEGADPDRTVYLESEIFCKDGTKKWIELSMKFLRDDDRKATGILGVSRDITERKRSENTLRESEGKYRLLADNITDTIWILNFEKGFTYISPSTEKLMGYTVEERMAMDIDGVYTPESKNLISRTFIKELEREGKDDIDPDRVVYLETEFFSKDGARKREEMSMKFMRDDDGIAIGVLGVSRDITERKRSEEVLLENEKKYRLLADNVSDTIWIMNFEKGITYISPSIEKLTGYTVEERIAMKQDEIYTPESKELIPRILFEELEKEGKEGVDPDRTVYFETEFYCKDGTRKWMENSVKFMRNDDGIAIGALGVSRDVTERKRSEETLLESERKYRLLADNVSDTIWVMNFEKGITYMSPSIEKLTGYSPEERMAMKMDGIYTPESKELLSRTLFEELEREGIDSVDPGRAVNLEMDFYCKDGTRKWSEESMKAIRDDYGKVIGVLGVGRDITERKKAEEELNRQSQILDEAQKIAQLGGWEYDVISQKNFWSDEVFNIYKVPLNFDTNDVSKITSFFHPEDRELILQSFQSVIKEQKSYDLELRFIDANKKNLWVRAIGLPVIENDKVTKVRGIFQDITERKQTEEKLQKALQENKVLLSELQHRAKNSFAMISSMINLSSIASESDETRTALSEAGSRVRAVSEMYDLLYKSDSVTEVRLDEYFTRVASSLPNVSRNINLKKACDPITVPLKIAVPVAIIVAELITNSIKYAFPDDRKGTISLSLKRTETGALVEVKDDGAGLPSGFDTSAVDSLGLKLVYALVNQIKGNCKIENNNGTAFIIEFDI